MATGRALLTDSEREYLQGNHGDQRMYEAKSRLRARINGPLAEDVQLLRHTAPGLLNELQAAVCEND